jgi:multidrug transporter EmrE-like cation transporter
MKMNDLGVIDVNSLKAFFGYFFALAKSPVAIAGFVLFMVAPAPFAIALSRMELSTAYPLSVALSCLIVVLLSTTFFGEPFTLNKILAIAMIIVSLHFLYR